MAPAPTWSKTGWAAKVLADPSLAILFTSQSSWTIGDGRAGGPYGAASAGSSAEHIEGQNTKDPPAGSTAGSSSGASTFLSGVSIKQGNGVEQHTITAGRYIYLENIYAYEAYDEMVFASLSTVQRMMPPRGM